jgi:hypothetical protein
MNRHNIASISERGTGIENLILWIGCKLSERPVIKVSNNPEDLTGNDLFSIDVENFNIVGLRNKSFITDEVLENIISFIRVNKSLIIKFTNEEIFTDQLVDELLPYKS